jgi:hypothetical protein
MVMSVRQHLIVEAPAWRWLEDRLRAKNPYFIRVLVGALTT